MNLIEKDGKKDKVIDVKEDNQNNIGKRKCCNPKCNDNIILQLLILLSEVITITIIVLSQLLYYDGEISMNISEELMDNFQTGYFMNFTKSSLPSNFDPTREPNENLIQFGYWQGTSKGCGTKDNKAKILEEGKSCEKDEVVLSPLPSMPIYSYKGIVLSGITKKDYYSLLQTDSIVKENKDCPDNKTLCGYIDTLKNKLCLDKGSTCPINYVSLSKNPPNIKNYHVIEGKNGINLYFSNNPYPDGEDIPYIVNSFRIADEKICSLPNLYYSGLELFELDNFKKKYSTNCVLNDYSQKIPMDKVRYHPLDSVDNYNLYEENNIIKKINNSNLTKYGFNIDNYKEHYVTLYIRTHFGFDYECLQKRDPKFDLEHLNILNGKAQNMQVFGRNMLYNILNGFFGLTDLFSFTDYGLEILIKKIGIFLPSLIVLIISLVDKIWSDDDPYEEEMKCSDFITNNNYNIMIYKIRKSGIKILAAFILLIILNVINLIIAFFSLIQQLMGKKSSLKKENEEQNIKNEKQNEKEDPKDGKAQDEKKDEPPKNEAPEKEEPKQEQAQEKQKDENAEEEKQKDDNDEEEKQKDENAEEEDKLKDENAQKKEE